MAEIPEPRPVEDGQPRQGGFPGSGDQHQPRRRPRPLFEGRDEVSISAGGRNLLGMFRSCILRNIQEALGVREPEVLLACPEEGGLEPEKLAERICSEVGALIQGAHARGQGDPVPAVLEGARKGTEQGLAIAAKLGALEGEGGERITALLEAWARHLERLTRGE